MKEYTADQMRLIGFDFRQPSENKQPTASQRMGSLPFSYSGGNNFNMNKNGSGEMMGKVIWLRNESGSIIGFKPIK